MANFLACLCLAGLLGYCDSSPLTLFKDPPPCGEWLPYKNEKCIKIALSAGHQNHQDAEIICDSFAEDLRHESYPTLITIKTKEEQEFFHKLLFVDNKIDDPVWLGLKEIGNSGQFQWNDGSTPYFTNWSNQTVSDDEHHCVQLESGGGVTPAGLWIKAKCTKVATVVCERRQTLTLETLQNLFFNNQLEQNRIIADLKQQNAEAGKVFLEQNKVNTDLKQRINDLEQNPVPRGFIYVQLPGQDSPTTLWPGMTWTEVSGKYAGLFFRVVGGNAAAFGQIQEGNTTRLEGVEYNTGQTYTNPITIPYDGSWSQYIYNGANSGTNLYLRFRLSKEEIRPRNQAVKIWQRTK